MLRSLAVVMLALVLAGCGRDEPIAPTSGETFQFQSGAFTVASGEEKFLCYAQTLTEDLVIDRFEYAAQPVVHHLIIAKTLAPEPEGFSECDTLYRATWQMMFGATTADTKLDLPPGAAVVLPKGTQILAQLHLLNSGKKDVTHTFSIDLHRSPLVNPTPTGIYVFGRTQLELPPKQTTTIEHTCRLPEDITTFAVIPHMHYLGRALRLDVGNDPNALSRNYERDPYDFDDQRLELFPRTFAEGSYAKVSCDYDNDTDKTVVFGESSTKEMCFLVMFALGREGVDGCEAVPPSDAGLVDAGGAVCGEQSENPLGVGKKCTKDGKECPSGLACSLDQSATPPSSPGFCFKAVCDSVVDCGGGDVVCCAPKQAGGFIKTCLPSACQPTDCL